MKKIRKIIALSIATVMLSLSSITVFASSSLNVTPLEDANDFSELKSDSFSEGIPLPKSAYSRANMQFTSGSLHYSDTLTSDDSTDLYFFSVSSTRFASFTISSSNSNYIAELVSVDWDAGLFYPTGMTISPKQGNKYVNGVTSGDWAFYVHSANTVGDSYTISANVKCPSNVTQVLYISPDFSKQVVKLESGSIYQNNRSLSNIVDSLSYSKVEFEMEDSWPVYPSGTEYYTHDISDGKIKSVSVGEYYTNKISIPNALWVKLDQGTLWTYTHSIVNNGSTLSFEDVTGQKTPRRFNYADVDGTWGDHYLIYDMDSGSYVDFFSVYNIFFATGGQKITDDTKIFATIK